MLEFHIFSVIFPYSKNPNMTLNLNILTTEKLIKRSDRRNVSDFRIWRSLARLCRPCRALIDLFCSAASVASEPSQLFPLPHCLLWGIFHFLSAPPSFPRVPMLLYTCPVIFPFLLFIKFFALTLLFFLTIFIHFPCLFFPSSYYPSLLITFIVYSSWLLEFVFFFVFVLFSSC